MPFVSFIIVSRNASEFLKNILSDLLRQDYPKDKIEIILVDGRSTDNTLKIMKEFKNIHKERDVIIIDNHRKQLACGWNLALGESKGDILIRVDAHSSIQPDFISNNVTNILSGKNIVGGPTIGNSPSSRVSAQLIALIEKSKFGCGVAAFRNPGRPRYVDTIAYAAYKRDVFKKVGGLDERLNRAQDNELHYRMKEAGFKFFFDPKVKSVHISRSRLHEFIKQQFSNGFWAGMAIGIQPRCLAIRHFTPALFVASLIIVILLGINGIWLPLISLSTLYILSSCIFTIKVKSKSPLKIQLFCIFLPAIFLLTHLSYGIGTWFGLVKMPFFVWNNRKYKIPWPIRNNN